MGRRECKVIQTWGNNICNAEHMKSSSSFEWFTDSDLRKFTRLQIFVLKKYEQVIITREENDWWSKVCL